MVSINVLNVLLATRLFAMARWNNKSPVVAFSLLTFTV